MNEKRGHWYLLTGLVIGLLLGLFYSTVLAPAEFIDVSPDMLHDDLKDEYRGVIALSYQANGDLGRAQARLSLLNDKNSVTAMQEQSQRLLKQGGSRLVSQALLSLASAVGDLPQPSPPIQQTPTPTEGTSSAAVHTAVADASLATETIGVEQIMRTPTAQPTPTSPQQDIFTVQPTKTAPPTLNLPFKLQERYEVCEADMPPGLLQIEVQDENGSPVAGAQINITWNEGDEFFFTGLYPDKNLGYADYEMAVDKKYRLRVGDGGEVVDDLQISQCIDDRGQTFDGGVYLFFIP